MGPGNDDRDAEAIAEAATRPTMRFVELKSAEQLDMQSLHRVRDRLVGERTALLNQLRAVLLERGFTAPQGRRKLEQALAVLLDRASGEEGRAALSPRVRALVDDLRAEWAELDRRIAAYDDEFALRAKADEAARRLATIPGIGVLNATALVAAIGNGATFTRGRDLAAWLGLVPRQATTGGKPKLLGISKRGNKYVRKLLIHGARSAMPSLLTSATPLGAWLRGLVARVHKNKAAVALASKLARIAWAVLRQGEPFAAGQLAVAARGIGCTADPARAAVTRLAAHQTRLEGRNSATSARRRRPAPSDYCWLIALLTCCAASSSAAFGSA